MKKLVVLALAGLFLLSIIPTPKAGAAGSWWNVSWTWRKQLTFDNTFGNLNTSSEVLSNFPVMVRLSSQNFDFSKARPSGQDIRFIDSDDLTALNYEIEKWDATGQEAIIWVKVPQVSSTNTDSIYMYYGNPAASDAQTGTSTWESSYVGVWHLRESGNGTAGEYKDSTTSVNNGRGGGGTSTKVPSLTALGKIDGAQLFDGTDDYITMGTTNFNLSAGSVTAWARNDTASNAGNRIIFSTAAPGNASRVYFFRDTSGNFAPSIGAVNPITLTPAIAIDAINWHQYGLTWNNGTYVVFFDGIQVGTGSYTGMNAIGTTLDFGDYFFAHDQQWNGPIDEVKVSNTARSTAWVAATYQTERDHFISYLPEAVNPMASSFSITNEITAGANGKNRVTGSVVTGSASFIITNVECAVNGGGFGGATPSDGSFDETNEDFYFDFFPTDANWKGAGYTVRCKATKAGGAVIDHLFYFTPFQQNEPTNNMLTQNQFPAFSFSVNTQRDQLRDNLQKYVVQVKRGNENWRTYIDEIPITFDSNNGNGVYEDKKIRATYSEAGSRIDVYAKPVDEQFNISDKYLDQGGKKLRSGSYLWKVVAVDKAGHSLETGSRYLRINGADSYGNQWFPLQINSITGLGRTYLSSIAPQLVKPKYRVQTSNPTFTGIAVGGSSVELDLTNQTCQTKGGNNCLQTFTTTVNGASQFSLATSTNTLKAGNIYQAQFSVSQNGLFNALPPFLISR